MGYQYDTMVTGTGLGRYETIIKAAQMGKKICIIEPTYLGDIRLNVGCIPAETLIKAVNVLDTIKHAADFAVESMDFSASEVDMAELQKRRQRVVPTLVGDARDLFCGNEADTLEGTTSFADTHTLTMGNKQASTEYITIATGSSVFMPPFIAVEEENQLLTSTEVLEPDEAPNSVAATGGGVIGVELAFLLGRLDNRVTALEPMDHILPMVDPEVPALAQKRLEKGGATLRLGAKVSRVEDNRVYYEHNGVQERPEAGVVLMAVDRTPNTEGLNAQGTGLEFDRNAIKTNFCLRTDVPNIYVIGDVNGKAMLAHTASHGGMVAVANICGHHKEMHYDCIPSYIYPKPEIACISFTEPQARKNYGDNLRIGHFSTMTNGKSLVEGGTDSLFRVIVTGDTGEILGAHLYGQHVTDMIGEISAAITTEATVEELVGSIHSHPIVNRALEEAFMIAWNGKAINSLQAVRILCVGDSFTFGYGVSTTRWWAALCGQMLGVELMNCAISDNTTGGMLARLEYQTDRVKPRMVLLMRGFSDILLSSSGTAARSNLGAMGHIAIGWGAIPAFGTPPLPCPPVRVRWNGLADLEQVGEQTAAYRDWIHRVCGVSDHPLLDLHQKLIRVAAREGWPLSDYFLDDLHMNEEGNQAIAETVALALRRIMGR